MKFTILGLLMAICLIIVGCAERQVLSKQAALEAYPDVASLEQQVNQAHFNKTHLLSPKHYSEAQAALTKALEDAKSKNRENEQFTKDGLAAIEQARNNAEQARAVFEDVLNARNKAMQAGADDYRSEQFNKADARLKELARLLEAGRDDAAKADREALKSRYSHMELASLKASTVEKAKQAISSAKANEAEAYAPQTMAVAAQEISLATGVLQADRSNREKAEQHAQRALYKAQHARQIAELAQHFEASDYTNEDIILWYQDQLQEAVQPLANSLPFNQANRDVVDGIHQQVAKLKSDFIEKTETLALLESEIKNKKSTLASLKSEKKEALQKARSAASKEDQISHKFAKIEQLFDQQEADVYRQQEDVLINAHGFAFPVGKSIIQSNNFPLLNKIITAVKEFPEASIRISGHTDGSGSAEHNKQLSQNRADKVAQFLENVGGVDAERIEVEGYGESRPVANNGTAKGRAANRRVEILIENVQQDDMS